MTEHNNIPSDISYTSELKRKILHIAALIIPFCVYLLGKEQSLWILIPLSTLALTVEVARVRIKSIASLINTLVGPLMRNEEKPEIGSPVVINGASWVLISATLLTIIFPVHIACASLSIFILGDAAAALIGRKFGTRQWPHSQKTIEGSLAFFIMAAAALAFFKLMPWYFVVLVSGIAMLLEVMPLPINDNIHVPILTGFAIFSIEYAYGNPQPSLFF